MASQSPARARSAWTVASVTMDLYGHLVDGNLWQAAWVVGGI